MLTSHDGSDRRVDDGTIIDDFQREGMEWHGRIS